MLTIITINYNGAEKTIKLLESLKNQSDKNFNILVLDNASDNTDFEKLKLMTSQVIRSEENLGFGGGINFLTEKGLKNGTNWLLILNNDVTTNSDFISLIRPNLSSQNDILAIPLDESFDKTQGKGGKVAYSGKIEWLKPTLSHYYSYKEYRDDAFAIGGGMVIRKDVFEKLKGFDPKYFLYFEDADFSVRAKKFGFKIKSLEYPAIQHEISFSAKKLGSPLLLRYHYRNALYFNQKNGPWYIKLAVWPWSLLIVLKQIIKITINLNKEQPAEILKGVFDWYLRKMSKIKCQEL